MPLKLSAATKQLLTELEDEAAQRMLAAEGIGNALIAEAVETTTDELALSVAALRPVGSLRQSAVGLIAQFAPTVGARVSGAVVQTQGHAKALALGQTASELAGVGGKLPPALVPKRGPLDALEVDRATAGLRASWGTAALAQINKWERANGKPEALPNALRATPQLLRNQVQSHAAWQAATAYNAEHQRAWGSLLGRDDGGGGESEIGLPHGWSAAAFTVWTAILDGKTCPICGALDGQMVPVGKSFTDGATAPIHLHCRCTQVNIVIPEALQKRLPGIQLDYQELKQDITEYFKGSKLAVSGNRHAVDFIRDALHETSPVALAKHLDERRNYLALVGPKGPKSAAPLPSAKLKLATAPPPAAVSARQLARQARAAEMRAALEQNLALQAKRAEKSVLRAELAAEANADLAAKQAKFAEEKLAKQKAAQEAEKKALAAAKKEAKAKAKAEAGLGQLTQIGPQAGSNPGGLFQDEHGTKWYIKTPKSVDHARNEVLAAELYRAAGVEVPELRLVQHDGQTAVASRIVDGAKKDAALLRSGAPPLGTHQGFAADAWLANWDVVGAGYDNLLVVGEGAGARVLRVDTGGALRFRAQGGAKGEAFGSQVGEISSLRWGNNPQAAAVFGSISDKQVIESMDRVLAVKPAQIKAAVSKFGPVDAAERKKLEETLLARRVDIKTQRAELLAKLKSEAKATANPNAALTDAERAWKKVQAPHEADAFLAKLPERHLEAPPPVGHSQTLTWNGEVVAQQPIVDRSLALRRRLTANEIDAVHDFTGDGYTAMRDSEATGSPSLQSKLTQAAIDKGHKETDVVVWRGMKRLQPEAMGQWLSGKPFQLGNDGLTGTASSSRSQLVAETRFANVERVAGKTGGTGDPIGSYKVIMKLRNRRGVAIDGLSRFASEEEILQPADAKFRTTAVYRLKGFQRVFVIEAEGLD